LKCGTGGGDLEIGVVECSSVHYRKVVSEWDCWCTSALRYSLVGISGRRVYYKWWGCPAGSGGFLSVVGLVMSAMVAMAILGQREERSTSQGYNLQRGPRVFA